MMRYVLLHSKYSIATVEMQSKEKYIICNRQSISEIPNDISNLFFGGYTISSYQVYFLQSFLELKSIEIGNNCFQNVQKLIIDGLPHLERVIIHCGNFKSDTMKRQKKGYCRITNCPCLRELSIYYDNFEYFKSFELSNVNSLQTIVIEYECFQNVHNFVLDGLERLESVNIGEKCFLTGCKNPDDGLCRITNCPNLHQLEIGNESFGGFKSFELSNVNSLQSIEFGNWCFYYAEDCSLKGE